MDTTPRRFLKVRARSLRASDFLLRVDILPSSLGQTGGTNDFGRVPDLVPATKRDRDIREVFSLTKLQAFLIMQIAKPPTSQTWANAFDRVVDGVIEIAIGLDHNPSITSLPWTTCPKTKALSDHKDLF